MLEPLGKEPKRIEVNSEFDLLQEMSRGALLLVASELRIGGTASN